MIIQPPGVWNLPQYINADRRIYEVAPRQCFSCGAVGAVQGHGHYGKAAWEGDIRKLVRIHRLLCRACAETFSEIFAFLVPRKRYTARIIAKAIKLARLIEPLGMLWIHLRFALGWSPEFALIAKRAVAVVG